MSRCCQARQYTDEMHCQKCRLRWDVSDPEPPTCRGLQLVVATRAHDENLERSNAFVSALAPDPWAPQSKR